MTNDDAAKKAEELPCVNAYGSCWNGEHHGSCPAYYRERYAAALRAAQDEGRAEYHGLLAIAVRVVEGLAEQQAMPDDGYCADLELLRAATSATTGMQPCPECAMDTRFHAENCKYHHTAYERGYLEGRDGALEEVHYSESPFPNQMFGHDGPYIHSPLCQGNGRAAVRRANALSIITYVVKDGWNQSADEYVKQCEDPYIVDALRAVRAALRTTPAPEGGKDGYRDKSMHKMRA